MQVVRFEIPGQLPTMNEIVAASKSHYGTYSKMKKKYTQKVMGCAEGLPSIESADFRITWHCVNRRKDKDNIVAGQKFIFDGLVECGVLKNDGWNEVGEIAHSFAVDKENPRIVVEIQTL
ncbi:Holliday junction resolvase [Sporosarcina highlanderae]|uniref:Holliday junction resolvase n=1 Tax=Sporosarcina highlanderae TaxID=3035916 RepID=A0ABT8JWG5_9BACL|nr:Holliday junction resolvase [Sporosarcina highlanderae]MDN4609148.1 Holliday junction resolvase [Sporosarcina highlanderae]